MIVIAVDFRVDPREVERFRERVRKHAANSLSEPGCMCFDVAEDRAEPGRFLIWETYVDEAAVEHHSSQAYLAEFRDAVAGITKQRELTVADMLTS